MKTGLVVVGGVAAVALAIFAFYMVDVDQTQEARLPDVDVSVEEGQLPEFDVDVGEIAVGETEVEIEVPEVEVTTTTETVTVPTLSIDPPAEDGVDDEG